MQTGAEECLNHVKNQPPWLKVRNTPSPAPKKASMDATCTAHHWHRPVPHNCTRCCHAHSLPASLPRMPLLLWLLLSIRLPLPCAQAPLYQQLHL
jgi:hypothetical protein